MNVPYFRDTAPHPEGFDEVEPTDLGKQPPHRLIDVRDPEEAAGDLGVIPGSELVPLSTLHETAARWNRDEPLIVVCRSGRRSARAVHALHELGFHRTVNLRGGMLAYHEQRSRR